MLLENKKSKHVKDTDILKFLKGYITAVKTFSPSFTVELGKSSQTYQVSEVDAALQTLRISDQESRTDKAHKVLAVIDRFIHKGQNVK
jgi:uncharacterized protein YigE (DUF2233 family)